MSSDTNVLQEVASRKHGILHVNIFTVMRAHDANLPIQTCKWTLVRPEFDSMTHSFLESLTGDDSHNAEYSYKAKH